MTQQEQANQFAVELDALVGRMMAEYDLTATSIIGILEIKKLTMFDVAKQHAEDEE